MSSQIKSRSRISLNNRSYMTHVCLSLSLSLCTSICISYYVCVCVVVEDVVFLDGILNYWVVVSLLIVSMAVLLPLVALLYQLIGFHAMLGMDLMLNLIYQLSQCIIFISICVNNHHNTVIN